MKFPVGIKERDTNISAIISGGDRFGKPNHRQIAGDGFEKVHFEGVFLMDQSLFHRVMRFTLAIDQGQNLR